MEYLGTYVARGVGRAAFVVVLLTLVLVGCNSGGDLDPEESPGNAPNAPFNVQAVSVANGIEVTWTDNSVDETGFHVFRRQGTDQSATADLVTTVPEDTVRYLDTDVVQGETYSYLIAAVGQEGDSISDESAPVTFDGGAGGDDTGGDDTGGDTGDDTGNDSGGDDTGGDTGDDTSGDDTGGDDTGGDDTGNDDTGGGDDTGGDDGSDDTGDDTGGDDTGGGDTGGDDGTGDDDSSDAQIVVTSSAEGSSDSECTLSDAIRAANSDEARGGCPAGSGADTIVLESGATYTLSSTYDDYEGPTGLPSFTSEITLQGNGASIERAGDAQFDGEAFRLLHVGSSGDLTISDLTAKNGSTYLYDSWFESGAPRGGGLFIAGEGKATVVNAIFDGNLPDAIFNGGTLTLTESKLTGAAAGELEDPEAYALFNSGTATLQGVDIVENSVTGIFNDEGGQLSVSNSTIALNNGTSAFVGAMINSGYAEFVNSVVEDNSGYDNLGGIDNRGELVFEGGRISENDSVASGGGLSNARGATATLRNTALLWNFSDFRGGAISNAGTLILDSVALNFNGASSGGGALATSGDDSTVTFSGETSIVQNSATGHQFGGGGIDVGGGTVVFNGPANIRSNESDFHGGGIFVGTDSHVSLNRDVAITLNEADHDGDGQGSGGGVYVEVGGTFESNGATIENNEPDNLVQ